MPFSTGTARHSTELLQAINTHVVANTWTKLRGEEDMNCASPKAARYWRMMATETQSTTAYYRGVKLLNFRTTPGGANVATMAANFTISDLGAGTASNLISGGTVRSRNIGSSRAWWITYDFTSPTIVREIYMRADSTVGYTPRSFLIQWSHDNETWTTMFEAEAISWSASEYKTFTFNDGFLASSHPAATAARRSGSFEDQVASTNWETSGFRHLSNDFFMWQGLGYDASRRVYIQARSHSSPAVNSEYLEFNFAVGYNPALRGWFDQAGVSSQSVFHFFGGGTIDYWIYSNSKRLILVTRTGAGDYSSTYVGFMSAFSSPDYYPFPLVMSSSAFDRSAVYNTTDNGLSSMADPGFKSLVVRLWDGTVKKGGNRIYGPTEGLTVTGTSSPFPYIWPHYFGKSDSNDRFPYNLGAGTSGSLYANQTLMEKLSATQQDDVPLIAAIVQEQDFGNLGALDGVFILPGGGVVAAEQALNISGINYRIFPNRTRRLGASWLAVRED